ncbi:cell invasion protein [Proteus vulgaris]|uniref:IpaD/SipD/SspD family type III secretion system needle tip protein n=1 Tax=Proteus vulgaris TaxID=585 RepID=UPI000E07BA29|nr:IpaD/SipD/SspD family type III secretion system needle tip protein [Proteus vulgaris]SUC13575.1 cell invasion protein [Proteus vulgaris]
MAKAIDSGMSNIANYSKIYSSDNNVFSTFKNEKHVLDDMKKLLINRKREENYFDLNNWISCNNLKGKTDMEIFVSLSAQYDKNIISHNQYLNAIKKLEPIIKDEIVDTGYSTDSLSDFFYEIKQSIIVGKNDYLDVLKDVFSNYMDYVRELRTAITSLSQYVKAGKKEGRISINYVRFYGELKHVIKKYNEKGAHFFHQKLLFKHLSNGGYVRNINENNIFYLTEEKIKKSVESIERLLKEVKGISTVKKYGLDETNNEYGVNNDISVQFNCVIDLSDVEKCIKNIEPYLIDQNILLDSDIENKRKYFILENERRKKEIEDIIASGGIYESTQPLINVEREIATIVLENNKKIEENLNCNDILQTEFDLFKKSLDSLEKKINSNLDELSKKYSSANSNYDNFVKIVSSTMNTLLEMAKGFLRF